MTGCCGTQGHAGCGGNGFFVILILFILLAIMFGFCGWGWW